MKPMIHSREFEGEGPDPAKLSNRWRELLDDAAAIVGVLPASHVGECVLSSTDLFRGGVEELQAALGRGELRFHRGSIRGASPRIVGS